MKYYVETADGGRVGPYSLSEVVDKFGDNAVLILAGDGAQIQNTDSPDREGQSRSNYPTQLELPKLPKADGLMVLAAIALTISLLGTLSIAFGFFASTGRPPEYQLTHAIFGLLGLLMNATAALVALCALIVRPSIIPAIALAFAILSSGAFIFVPPQSQPKLSSQWLRESVPMSLSVTWFIYLSLPTPPSGTLTDFELDRSSELVG